MSRERYPFHNDRNRGLTNAVVPRTSVRTELNLLRGIVVYLVGFITSLLVWKWVDSPVVGGVGFTASYVLAALSAKTAREN